jgi:hypothetical protein
MFFGPQYGTQIGSSKLTTSITVDNEALTLFYLQLFEGQKYWD